MKLKTSLAPILLVLWMAGTAGVFAQETIHYIPQVGHGGGFETTLYFVNLSNTTNRVEVRAFLNSGEPAEMVLQPASPFSPEKPALVTGVEMAGLGTSSARSLTATPEVTQAAYMEVRSEAPVGVEVVFRFFSNNNLAAATSVLPEPLLKEFSFAAFRSSAQRSGVALLNPAANKQPANLQITLLDRVGRRLLEKAVVLPAGQKISRFVDEAPLFPELTDNNFIGSVEVRSDVPVAVTVIKVENGSLLSTQTVQPARRIF